MTNPWGVGLNVGEEPTWWARASCARPGVDPEIFSLPLRRPGRPPAHEVGIKREPDWSAAREMCGGCPVRNRCLEDTLASEPEGDVGRYLLFAGGCTPDELTELRRRARR